MHSQFSQFRLAFLTSCVLLWGTACTDLLGPGPPIGAIPLSPLPAEYTGWWALTERCARIEGNAHRVEWLVYPGPTIPGTDGAVGAWYSRTRTIVLAAGQETNGPLVRHEMLHALLDRRGHSRSAFVASCGAIVSCDGRCLDDVGGPVSRDLDALIVDMSVLRVSVAFEPQTVSLSAGTRGCVTLVVSALNSASVPVRVRLEGPAVLPNQSFGWMLQGYRGGATETDSSLMPFSAGETRRHVFECAYVGPVRNRDSPGPGTYAMTGYVRSISDSLLLKIVE